MAMETQIRVTPVPASTVGRAKSFRSSGAGADAVSWRDNQIHLFCGDSLAHYKSWERPDVIVSDGGYGILGFEGDTPDHLGLPDWYEPHIEEWSKYASAKTTLWFWNSEIGWAVVHPVLEKFGWQYVNCNIWHKGKAHIAGNVNTEKIRRFPVVTEVCAHYVFEEKIDNLTLKNWLIKEWKRTGLPFRKANEACGVKDAATRKYLDKGRMWYFPPPDMFGKMVAYANKYGNKSGAPYFSRDGEKPMSTAEWSKMRAVFNCPYGYTSVWERAALRGRERVKAPNNGSKSAHLNQKPLDLMMLIIEASSHPGDVVWEPFGGLFSASLAAKLAHRKAFACEVDPDYFRLGVNRFKEISLF